MSDLATAKMSDDMRAKVILNEIRRSDNVISSIGVGKSDLIRQWLDEMHVTNYTINDDMTINVRGNVDLSEKDLTRFPDFIQFNHIVGNFWCHNNRLTSLRGAPLTVDRSFGCSSNQLATLIGAPKKVGSNFYCSDNLLTSLEGAPQEVGMSFYCYRNKLTSLDGIGGVKGKVYRELNVN